MNQSIYVIESEFGLVKIGRSQNPERRIRTISTQGGFAVQNTFYTKMCSNAAWIENELHRQFASDRTSGEWFTIDHSTAVEAAKKIFSERARFESDTKFNPAEIMLAFHQSFFMNEFREDILCLSDVPIMYHDGQPVVSTEMFNDWEAKGRPFMNGQQFDIYEKLTAAKIPLDFIRYVIRKISGRTCSMLPASNTRR